MQPGALAVVTPDMRLTFAQLEEAARRAASQFHAEGLRPYDRAGISLADSVTHLVTSLALIRLGVAQVALPLTDPPLVRQAVAARLGLGAVIGSGSDAAAAGPRIVEPDPAWIDAGAPPAREAVGHSGPDTPWLILSSSGTTGEPKFAELTHAGALDRLRRFAPMGRGREDRFWSPSKLDFVVAKQRSLYSLWTGASLCFTDQLASGGDTIEFLRQQAVTFVCATPFHMHLLLSQIVQPSPLRGLRVFEARSATIDEVLRARFRAECTPNLHITYGTNEAETITTASPELQARLADTVGRPMPGLEVEVVDEAGSALPAGEVGNIRIRGPGVVSGYVDNPEATAKSFRDGWFHPGDLGSFSADGALFLHGRADDMMIFDGINIYPAEIETVLAAHPAVAEATAFPLRSPMHQDLPAAAIRLRHPADEQDVTAFCRARLGVKTPRALLVVQEFPRNAMGKVLKRELAQRLVAKIAETGAIRAAAPISDKPR